MNKKLALIIIAILGLIIYIRSASKWVEYDDDVLIRKLPIQGNINQPAISHKGFTLMPVASFSIEARVLSKKKYLTGNEAKLAPIDLALGWGPMSTDRVLKKIKISQGNRWYYYRYMLPPPILKREIIAHSGNMHLIPADEKVAEQVKKVRPGEIVTFKGYLVNVTAPSDWRWNSSLSRTDIGRGSCEIVWVKQFVIR